MTTNGKTDLNLEIAHVLLVDVVGYSKFLVEAQVDLLTELNRIVRSSPRFALAESQGKLTRLPTGDGMALVFFDSPEAPVQCALEISAALREYPQLQLRMGAHSGPIKEIADVNDRPNFAGTGINLAQRVLDCGDAGHILLSGRLAEDLREYRQWHPYLHDLGPCEVKHGQRLQLFNLCKDGLGNPSVPTKLIEQRQLGSRLRKAAQQFSRAPVRQKIIVAAIATSVLLTAGVAAWGLWPAAPLPEKSIAVLPFASLSEDRVNAWFAEGMHDDIITLLTKLADVKVISRTSVMRYKPGGNFAMRTIGRELGVAHILEGSVQREGNRVRVNAQLIDTRTDGHVWAKRYDRELSEQFRIQTEIAEQIVAHLQRELSATEKAELRVVPTQNPAAYERYVRAKSLIDGAVFSARGTEDLTEAARLLNEAVVHDPSFYLAYYQLAHAHDQLYLRSESNPTHLASAEAAIAVLQRLNPGAGETHLAVAKHRYWGYRDYDGAIEQLALAETKLPNDRTALLIHGYIARRRGDWRSSTTYMRRAAELDPQNFYLLQQLSLTHHNQRQFGEMAAVLDRALRVAPHDLALGAQRAAVELEARADTEPLNVFIANARLARPAAAGAIADQWLYLALCRRDYALAHEALQLMSEDACQVDAVPFPRTWCEGVVARLGGNEAQARAKFAQARTTLEQMVAEQPAFAGAYTALGMAEAALGEYQLAAEHGRRAVQLLPIEKDAVFGPVLLAHLALIFAWSGQADSALEQLAAVAEVPSTLSYGQLKLHPYWDPLRNAPAFEQIVASFAPKE